MKKICLSVVLTVVSVFSIAAQTSDKSTKLTVSAEKTEVKTEIQETKPVTVEPTVKTVETDKPVTETEKKTETSEPVKKAETPETQTEQKIEPEKKAELPEAAKTQTTEAEKSAELAKPEADKSAESTLLAVKKATLGALSTGSPAIDGYIEEFCELYGVDPLLIYAQMNQESSFNSRATSGKGASGYMQLMPDTARRFGVKNIYNPKQNIQAGVKYMRWLLDKFGGDKRLALAGYNAGEGSVMKYGNKVPPYRETQNYVERIMNHYELITNQSGNVAEIIPTVK